MAPSEQNLLDELQAIKKLLVFALLREGATQSQIANTLGTSQSQISKMFLKSPGEVKAK